MYRAPRPHQSRGQRLRQGLAARVVVALLLAFLLVPLYRLQIRSSEQFVLQARQNSMRPMVVRAPRGTIYDRYGRIVAENTVGYQVLLMPAPLDTLRKKVALLQPILGMDSMAVVRAFRRYSRAPHLPMEVMTDAPVEAIARLQERRFEFPEVHVQEYAKRHYPAGPAIAHFIGYISEIDERELAQPEYAGYQQGRWIGKAGLEKQYERHLGGEPGVRYLEIDARGRIRDWLPDTIFARPPIPGKDLHLYLDLDLQEFIAHIFPREYTGAIVAIEPATGGVLAYYSNPSYDPNAFIGGVSSTYFNALLRDPAKPLLDRVVGSGQPAASTWKLAVAGMALDVGAIRPEEYMPIPCSGSMYYGNRYWRCWYTAGHGRMNLIEGIKNSCNIYFYQVGLRIGLDRFLAEGTRHGFGRKTGIDVPHEITPNFPDDREYWVKKYGYSAREGEVISMAIGQGPLVMTAIKLAHIYTALGAPDGRVPAPRLARGMDEKRDTFQFKLDPVDVWYLDAGMRRVVAPGGTAQLSRIRHWDFIGKTGTAQNPPYKDHGWFVGLGGPPGGKPEIAVTMFLEHAEHGYIPSGYVAEAINFYLDRKYGRPFGGWETPRHRIRLGLPLWDWSTPLIDPPLPGTAVPDTLPPAAAVPPVAPRSAGGN
jgi:penicillin-binding protein 2